MTIFIKSHWLNILVHLFALAPLVWLIYGYANNRLTANPIQYVTKETGERALQLLVLSLACTPIHTIFGFRPVLKVRRALGLYGFLWAALHFLTFVYLDFRFDLELIVEEIGEKRYILFGLAALTLLTPLAITSTKGWQKRLGRAWRRLHRAIYFAVPLIVLHFALARSIKANWLDAIVYGIVVALLLLARLPALKKALIDFRSRVSRKRQPQNPAN
jgi:sulfoxide reductase heme-binding subunit YedZ